MKTRKKSAPAETISYSPALSVSAELAVPNQFRPLALPSMFWKPNYLKPETPAWIGHLPFAFWIIEALTPSTFVELGTHYGNSYFAFCQAVDRLGLSTACFAVDKWKGDEHAGFYGDEVFAAVNTYNANNYSGISTLVRSTFDEALPHFEDGTIDLLHIDGHHTFEAVRHDFESWLPKLSKRAVVLFHDTNVRFGSFGVNKYFAKLKAEYPWFEFNHSHGLGVLGVGSEQPENVKHLFHTADSASATGALHQIFARLGQACIDLGEAQIVQKRVLDLEAQIGAKNQEIAECLANTSQERESLSERIAQLQTERANLENQLATLQSERDGRIAGLEGAVSERDGRIAGLEGAVSERDGRIAGLEGAVSERDGRIAGLEGAVSERDGRIAGLEGAVSELQSERDSLASERSTLDARLSTLSSEHSSLVAERDSLTAERSTLDARLSTLSSEHSSLVAERDSLASERSTLDARLSTLSSEHSLLIAERDDLATERSTLEARLSTLVDERDSLASERSTLDARLSALLAERDTLVTSHSLLVAERDDLATKREALATDLQERFEELAKLAKLQLSTEDERNALQAKVSELQSERDSLASERSTLDARLSALLAERDTLATSHSLLATEREALSSDLSERFEEIALLGKRLLEVEAEGDQRVAALQARMDAIQARFTWKLGAPFRFAWDKTRNTALKIYRLPTAWRILRLHRSSGLFNHEWYYRQNPDVKATTARPFLHFAFHGVFEGRSPNPSYNESAYLRHTPSAQSSSMKPLLHYTLKGWKGK